MELTTIIGLILGIIGLLGGMIFKGVPFSALLNPAAIFMIIIGTAGAVLNAFPSNDAKVIPTLFKLVFTTQKGKSNVEIVSIFVDLAGQVRKDGLFSLEKSTDVIDDPFFKRGIDLLMTGQNKDFIEDVLTEELETMESRHMAYAGIFTQAGTYAPTLGVLGAVVGLIAAMGFMDDTKQLAHAISGAFMATIYGIFTGYVVWHPFANKLKRKSKHEILTKTIIIQGILLLEQGISQDLIKESLASYLPRKESDKILNIPSTTNEEK